MKNLVLSLIIGVSYIDITTKGDKQEVYIEFTNGKHVTKLFTQEELDSQSMDEWADELYIQYVEPYNQEAL